MSAPPDHGAGPGAPPPGASAAEVAAAAAAATALEPVPPAEGRTHLQIAWRRFRRHRLGLAGLAVLVLLALGALLQPALSPYSYGAPNPSVGDQGPGWPHIFGTTDPLGQDVLTRVMYGGRTSIAVGLAAALAATLIGTVLGALAGYLGGVADSLISRLTDLFLTAPPLAVLIALGSVVDRISLGLVIAVIAALSWMPVARLVRAEVLGLREREFVLAARAMGAGPARIILRHLLPNVVSVVIVAATLLVGLAIIVESTLSFLGIGLDPISNPSWGNLLEDARSDVEDGWWLVVFPGAAIILTVLSVSFVGDALRDALDPRRRGAARPHGL
jgi:peptide/nickel transport system permease protein